jgi:hypothetical protein
MRETALLELELGLELVPMVCTPAELARLAALPALDWPKLTFSAKEAWYKCQWPLPRRFCAFSALELHFYAGSGDRGRFRVAVGWAGDAAEACGWVERKRAVAFFRPGCCFFASADEALREGTRHRTPLPLRLHVRPAADRNPGRQLLTPESPVVPTT